MCLPAASRLAGGTFSPEYSLPPSICGSGDGVTDPSPGPLAWLLLLLLMSLQGRFVVPAMREFDHR
jgi:hypothetical protein